MINDLGVNKIQGIKFNPYRIWFSIFQLFTFYNYNTLITKLFNGKYINFDDFY